MESITYNTSAANLFGTIPISMLIPLLNFKNETCFTSKLYENNQNADKYELTIQILLQVKFTLLNPEKIVYLSLKKRVHAHSRWLILKLNKPDLLSEEICVFEWPPNLKDYTK